MKRVLVFLILLIAFFLEYRPEFIYAASLYDKVLKHDPNCPYANSSSELEKTEEANKSNNAQAEDLKAIKEAKIDADAEKKELESYLKKLNKLCEKIAKRTKDCADELDSSLFTVNSYIRKAQGAKDNKAYKEFVILACDYNSVLGDIGLMQVILDLGKSFKDEKFEEYYNIMESGYERLKDSFSFKNDIFLKRIDELKNQDALRYGKKLAKIYREYFQYDPRVDRIEEERIIPARKEADKGV